VITDLKELIAQIQSDQAKRNEYKIDEPLPISVFHTRSTDKKSSETINNDNFVYFQLLIDCLSRMISNSNDKKELIALCKEEYKDNETELNIVRDFKTTYSYDRAIWWFTRESFVCRMLNKAFQVLNIDLLYNFHTIIGDIRRQLKENKCESAMCTYRAQLMTNQEVKLLKNSIGQLISINTFLPTIPNRERALEIFTNTSTTDDVQRVLFEIEADPRLSGVKPFGDITSLNYFNGIEVILFMAGTIFHPIDIRSEKNIIIIQMETCSDSDQRIKSALQEFKDEFKDDETNLLLLGRILTKMKQYEHAEKCYDRFLAEMPNDHSSVAQCYRGLAQIALEREDYDSSIVWYQKAHRVDQCVLRPEDPEMASSHMTMGNVYVLKGDFSDAYDSFNEALRIWIRALGKDHPKVGYCYKHMAHAFEKEKRYFEAVDYYQKAITVRERNSSADNPDVANLHNHIGAAYVLAGDAIQAAKHHNLALNILLNNYPDKHPEVLKTLRDVALAHEAGGSFNQAKRQFEKLLYTHRQLLPPNHPDVIQSEKDVQRVSSKLK
jgi:tetratricopeptide (TPR) repeat protein